MALVVKNLLVIQEIHETQVWSLGWEDPLEEGMATHSCILDKKIPRTEKPGGLQSMGSERVRPDRSNLAYMHRLEPTRLLCPWDSLDKILEWVAIPFSRRSSQTRDGIWVSHTAGRFFTVWATREALDCPLYLNNDFIVFFLPSEAEFTQSLHFSY